MNRLIKISWLLMVFPLLALSACSGGNSSATQTVDTGPIFTQIASTALALQTQTALAMPPATDTPELVPTLAITDTPLVTDTPLPGTASATPAVLNTPLATSQSSSCDNMVGVTDVTIPDGYVAASGETMVKTWEVKNLGPCTWNQDYILIYGWGTAGTDWSKVAPSHLTSLVVPGDTTNISVTLKAPSVSGEYIAAFRLQNDKGYNFGPPQTIDIVVK